MLDRKKGGYIAEVQPVKNAFGKDNELAKQILTSEVMYVNPDIKRTNSWLQGLGLRLPSDTANIGSIGSINYNRKFVKLSGIKGSDIFEIANDANTRNSTMDDVRLSDKQYTDMAKQYESGDKSVEPKLRKALRNAARRNGYVLATYHGTSEYFNTFDMGVEGIHLGTEAIAKQVASMRYNNRSKQTA
jgi:hypothetical protein